MPTSNSDYERDKFGTFIALGVLIVFILWFFGGLAFRLFFGDDSGSIGDTFGGVNALFSGLAFGGLIAALWMQTRQIALQRDDLKLQREDLKIQRKEMILQREEMELSRREFEKQTMIQDANLILLQDESAERKKQAELALLPRLMLRGFKLADSAVSASGSLINAGTSIFDLQVLEFSSPFSAGAVTLNPDTILERNCSATVTWTSINTPAHIHGHYWIKLSYKDEMGAYQEIELEAHNHPK